MKLQFSMPGLLLLGYNEFRNLIKGSISSYSWFILLTGISTYVLFSEDYAVLDVSKSIMTFKYGNSPMTDILIFYSSSFISSVSDSSPAEMPGGIFPVSIGVAFFIVFPFFLSLILISKFITARATASIAKEREKKTLYILTVSPLTRRSIYFGKLLGILYLALPMIVILYFITLWIFTVLFPPEFNLSTQVLKAAGITALFFSSVGMLVSVLSRDEKKASWRGLRIIIAMAALTALWLLIPFIRFMLNITNKSADFLPVLEKITFISPFTMDLMYVYNPASGAGYLNIQLIATFLILVIGIIIFIRQDIEY